MIVITLHVLAFVVAEILFALAAFNVASPRFNLVAAGLFFLGLALYPITVTP